jgi:2,4-dienoyl-CoA reductase-like NADH-dependent reductase (Old Yellow Enzyme family)
MREKSVLFTPVKIGKFEIPNRFVRTATHDFMAEEDGTITSRQLSLFKELAEGEVGLIITGHAFVSLRGKASPRQIGVYDDNLIPGLKQIPKSVHSFPSRIFLQIAHAGRQTKEKLCKNTPLAPSAVYDPVFDVHPLAMTEKDIEQTMDDFIQAARRAKEADFDGIQLQVAHGYLLSSFISPYTNQRTDAYGGDLFNRLRIVVEILRGIKSLLGRAFPVIAKLNSTDFLPKGLDITESIQMAKILEQEGIDGIEVSGGMTEAGKASVWKGPFSEEEEGYFVNNASKIKANVSVPVFALGGLRTFRVMEKIIQEDKADLISISRPFIRNPLLVKNFRLGKIEKSMCISCNKCFNPRGIKCGDLYPQRTIGI